jgi:hydroxymethylpyrimidine/phosphomethylpyrimidine kinase
LDMQEAAKKIATWYQINVLVKGGHLNCDNNSSDVLYLWNKRKIIWFKSKRINTKNTHGTGCTLSSAIASYLAQNYSLIESINLAKLYLYKAIHAGSQIKMGYGNGPVDHFYFLRNK